MMNMFLEHANQEISHPNIWISLRAGLESIRHNLEIKPLRGKQGQSWVDNLQFRIVCDLLRQELMQCKPCRREIAGLKFPNNTTLTLLISGSIRITPLPSPSELSQQTSQGQSTSAEDAYDASSFPTNSRSPDESSSQYLPPPLSYLRGSASAPEVERKPSNSARFLVSTSPCCVASA